MNTFVSAVRIIIPTQILHSSTIICQNSSRNVMTGFPTVHIGTIPLISNSNGNIIVLAFYTIFWCSTDTNNSDKYFGSHRYIKFACSRLRNLTSVFKIQWKVHLFRSDTGCQKITSFFPCDISHNGKYIYNFFNWKKNIFLESENEKGKDLLGNSPYVLIQTLEQPCRTRRPRTPWRPWYIFLAPSVSTYNWADF
jgi:hypothetical protein